MAKFTNIRNDDQTPVMVDVENVAVLIDCTDKHQDGLYLSDSRQGRIYSMNRKDWDVDGESIAENIRKQGIEFMKLPFFFADKDYGHYYVNPAAVELISVSKIFTKPDDNSKYVTLLAGTQRGDVVETSYVPLDVAENLVEAIKRANPKMVEITSDMASTNIVQGGFTLLDPAQIRAVRPNGRNELNVSFISDAGISLRVAEYDAIRKDNSDYLNRLVKRLMGDGTMDELIKSIGDLNALMPRLQRREDLYTKRLVDKFAEAVLDNVDGLVKMEQATGAYYARPEYISSIRMSGDNALNVTFNKLAKEQYAPDMTIEYADGEAARSAMDKIIRSRQKP